MIKKSMTEPEPANPNYFMRQISSSWTLRSNLNLTLTQASTKNGGTLCNNSPHMKECINVITDLGNWSLTGN